MESRLLKAGPGGEPSRLHGRCECFIVLFVLVGVGDGEVGDCTVEGIALAQVGGDGDPVAPPGVGAGEGGGADARVQGGTRNEHAVNVGAALPVVELAHVVVAGHAV